MKYAAFNTNLIEEFRDELYMTWHHVAHIICPRKDVLAASAALELQLHMQYQRFSMKTTYKLEHTKYVGSNDLTARRTIKVGKSALYTRKQAIAR